MKTGRNVLGASLVAGALAVAAPQLALAAGTLACTQINNTASIAFTVGGVTQTPQSSVPATFYVGVKAIVAVTTNDSSKTGVIPGSTAAVKGNALSFRVTNSGNNHQKYALSALAKVTGTADPFGGAVNDSFDMNNVAIPDVPGKVVGGVILDLGPDSFQDVTIASDAPIGATDGQVAVYALKAQTQWLGDGTNVTTDGQADSNAIGGTVCSALATGTKIDVVVADTAGTDDGNRDGASSSRSAYLVTAANLNITKNSAVIWDPVNCTGSTAQSGTCLDSNSQPATPRLIPGGVVEYTITITNAASAATANVTVTDPLDLTNLSFVPNGYATNKGILVNGVQMTNAADGDNADYAGTTAGTVTVSNLSVAGGATAIVKFKATIN